jgi:hypothetical protein
MEDQGVCPILHGAKRPQAPVDVAGQTSRNGCLSRQLHGNPEKTAMSCWVYPLQLCQRSRSAYLPLTGLCRRLWLKSAKTRNGIPL